MTTQELAECMDTWCMPRVERAQRGSRGAQRISFTKLPDDDSRQNISIQEILTLLTDSVRGAFTSFFNEKGITTLGEMFAHLNQMYDQLSYNHMDQLANKIERDWQVVIHRLYAPEDRLSNAA